MDNNYFMGLDLGTGSLGWAITDSQYEIVRKHGNALWGVRLFESANTAEERRTYRAARRRLDRRNWRIGLLQEIFAQEISKVDQGFYLRMKESRYTPEDKRDANQVCPKFPYALFMDEDYTDKDYHRQFPTVYHLRRWLMTTDGTPDIRLIYLAFHHLIKHRGHFLFTGNIESIRRFEDSFMQFVQSVQDEELDFELGITGEQIKLTEEILKDSTLTKSMKKARLVKILGAHTACEKAIVTLLCGGKVNLRDIYGDSELDDIEKPKISFSESTYDEYKALVEEELGERFIIIAQAKAIYDWAVLADILGDHVCLSDAKVAVYEKHRKDLRYLKKFVKENLGKDVYRLVFVKTDEKLANYSAYVGMTKKNGRKQEMKGKLCSKEDFYAFLKKEVFSKSPQNDQAAYIENEIEKGTFLPKQVIKDNGVIPQQIHFYELCRIIENLRDRVPFLQESEEKIKDIFQFRIPYYVGPLNGIMKGNQATNWVQRKSAENIYPWNFQDVVDLEASAEQFIKRMTNKCTYLPQEDVLPKNSLLYSKFMVLNELNNLRINGIPVSVELKQQIYEQLFQRYRKVTLKKLRDYLIREGIIDKNADIMGIDGDFKGSLTAYHDFKEKLTDCTLNLEEKEKIILNITLFGEDKKLLSRRLEKMYPQLSAAQRKGLCGLSYAGWGRLSAKFLEGITAPSPGTGELWSVMQALWETNDNLMQILSRKYLFIEAIERENGETQIQNISYSLVESMNVSPSVKRQVWQTIRIVEELRRLMKGDPERMFIEMARGKGENERTGIPKARKRQLMDLYKACKTEEGEWFEALAATEEHRLRSDKLYLYYTQKGRCMYSGDQISLEDLWDNNKYDIDHIYPQSKVMDDSLDNRVLVKKTYNAEKTDHYPIAAAVRQKMRSFWQSLLDGGFISSEKYKRLTRATEFTPDELAGFIARQLVETRQSTKAVATILKQILPNTEIVYVKAKTVSQFRQDFDFVKVREMNDFHHAKDAYLNIVIGNAYYTKFTQNAAWYVRENPGRSYNLKRMFTSGNDIERDGTVAWKAGKDGTICTVRNTLARNNILVTRRNYQVKGGFFDQQLMKKGKGQVPIKENDERLRDIDKYGGYNKETGTYYMLIESEDKRGNKIRTIEYVPRYLCIRLEGNEETALRYFAEKRNLKNPKILLKRIKTDTLFKVDGFHMWLSGRTGNQLLYKSAEQLILDKQEEQILKKVLKYVQRHKENKEIKITPYDNLFQEDLLHIYDVFLDKIRNTIYHVRLSAQEKTLMAKREKFIELCMEEQCIVLSEILHMFQCQSSAANLKLLGGPEKAGILVLNNNITNCGQISIVNQSPTGIYRQEIDLKSI